MDEYCHKDVTQIGRFNCFTFNSSNVRLILKADVQNIQFKCLINSVAK